MFLPNFIEKTVEEKDWEISPNLDSSTNYLTFKAMMLSSKVLLYKWYAKNICIRYFAVNSVKKLIYKFNRIISYIHFLQTCLCLKTSSFYISLSKLNMWLEMIELWQDLLTYYFRQKMWIFIDISAYGKMWTGYRGKKGLIINFHIYSIQ